MSTSSLGLLTVPVFPASETRLSQIQVRNGESFQLSQSMLSNARQLAKAVDASASQLPCPTACTSAMSFDCPPVLQALRLDAARRVSSSAISCSRSARRPCCIDSGI